MPKDASTTNTEMGDTTKNPVQNVKGGLVVQVTLVYDGLSFDPAALFNALKTQYGSTKVSSDRDTAQRNLYQFRIIP